MIIKDVPEGKGRIAYAAELIQKTRGTAVKPARKKKPYHVEDDGTVRIREWHEGEEHETEVVLTLNKIYRI